MTGERRPVAVVGFGKIALDQHVPALADSADFRLAATVDTNGAGIAGVDHFAALDEMLDARPDIRAVSLCTPPQSRFDLARRALEAGRNVLLEKSPGVTVAEVRVLADLARDKDLVIFATWHSRFAHAVAEARDWLKSRQIRQAEIIWKEDVRYWHPGQKWIWRAGGLGVFDPGINALSVLTEILPEPAFVAASELHFPENCETPIAARMQMRTVSGAVIGVELDWRHVGAPIWDVRVETDAGTLALSDGGARLSVDGAVRSEGQDAEYAAVYARFAKLLATGTPDMDDRPLVHVADAFLLGRRIVTAPFSD